jgi:hypothetical protein
VIDFRECIKDCAQDPQFVEYFNRVCGIDAPIPIASLLDDRRTMQVSEEEQLVIGCFIVFVYENIWVRLKTASHRTGLRIETESSGRQHK